MDDDAFFEFCFELYKHERDEADKLYAKLPLGITANVVIGGAIVYLLEGNHIDQLFTRNDVFAYYTSALLGAVFLLVSSTFLAMSSVPKKYSYVSLPHLWTKWRKDAEDKLQSTGHEYTPDQVREYVAEHTRNSISQQLCDTAHANRQTNTVRVKYFVYAMRLTLLSLAPVFLQGLFWLIIWVQFRD